MQIVAQGAILAPASLSSPGRQVLWIQAHLYLADFNSKAFRLHPRNTKNPPVGPPFDLAVPEGWVQDEFLPDLGQYLNLSKKEISR
jgi:hypothetical protein